MTLNLDARTTALVIIDLQQGIVSRPLVPRDATTVIGNAARIGAALRNAGGLVVAVHVMFAPDHVDRLRQPVDLVMPAHPVSPEWAELVPEIQALAPSVVITKRQWGAFYGTELDLQLRRRGITTVIVCGIATNFGVESTVREAWQHNYAVIVAEDACATQGEGMHEFVVEKIFPRIARVRTTDDIVAEL